MDPPTANRESRKVHREKVCLADPDLAWDEICLRPRRQQAVSKRRLAPSHVSNDQVIMDDRVEQTMLQQDPALEHVTMQRSRGSSRIRQDTCQTSRKQKGQVPPLRLYRHQNFHDAMEWATTKGTRLLGKRHTLGPSPIEQKQAKCDLLAVVAALT